MSKNGIKRIFFWSDLHIGHKNCIHFDNRPFKDLDHMHRVLVNNYNSTVPEDGVCYFLGDIGNGKSAVIKDIIGQMHGTKIAIVGNHDPGVNALYNIGFDVVMHGSKMIIAGREVTLSHCPLLGQFREDVTDMKGAVDGECWHGESRHRIFSTHDRGQIHLHGHIHSPNGGKSSKILGRQFDVGVVANNYRPISISTIESWISRKHKR